MSVSEGIDIDVLIYYYRGLILFYSFLIIYFYFLSVYNNIMLLN